MKPAVRLLSLLMAICMLLSMLPVSTLAEDMACEVCQQTDCICCGSCDGTVDAHMEGCPETCLGEDVCIDGHAPECPLYEGNKDSLLNEEDDTCADCGQNPCTCDDEQVCEGCFEDPCICDRCDVCGQNPCECCGFCYNPPGECTCVRCSDCNEMPIDCICPRCPNCRDLVERCTCDVCGGCGNKPYYCNCCNYCGLPSDQCTCVICPNCNLPTYDCSCGDGEEGDWCPSCGNMLDCCECDRCTFCGNLREQCTCEPCENCQNQPDYCSCSRCPTCRNLEENCSCSLCEACQEKPHNCSCVKCDWCGHPEGYCVCQWCDDCHERLENCTCGNEEEPGEPIPMYMGISGSNNEMSFFDCWNMTCGEEGPWVTFHPNMSTDTHFYGVESSDEEILQLNGNGYAYKLIGVSEGPAEIIYTDEDGQNYYFPVMVNAAQPPTLRFQLEEDGFVYGGRWRVAPGAEGIVRFFLGTDRYTDLSNPLLSGITVDDSSILELTGPDPETGSYTFKAVGEGSTMVVYTEGESRYMFEVSVEEQQFWMIPVQPSGPPNWIDLAGLTIGEPVELRCFLAELYGPPVGEALTGITSSDETVFELSISEDEDAAAAGVHVLTPTGAGVAQIEYMAGDKTYSCEVIVMEKNFKAEGMVYYPAVHGMSGKTYPKTVLNLNVGDGVAKEFFYSDSAEAAMLAEEEVELTPLTINDVTWSGPIQVVQPDGDTKLHIIGEDVGTGYLEVTSEDGITHCFVVNVGRGRPDTEIQEGGYMWLDDDIVIGFGNPGISSDGDNNAQEGVLKMRAQVNNGFDYNYPDEYIYREPVAFAALDQTNGIIAETVMKNVSNVEFSILACQNTDGTDGSYASMEKDSCEEITLAEGVKAWTNYVVAGGKEAFKGLVGMTFDLPDTNSSGETITRRISLYILLHNTYMGEEVRVEANIESAAQLNVILSSYEALKTWIKQEHPEYAEAVDRACNVDLKLPGGDFTDAIVVYEAIAPFPFRDNPISNPNFRVYLHGPTKGERTTLAGLISRGSLAAIDNVQFAATEGVTMTRDGETFTCGLMADANWSGHVEYDMEFAEKYGIDPTKNKRNVLNWKNDGGMGNADCDILTIQGCSFDGFDYGTRSTPDGYVGGGEGNSFTKCFFGVYIDCPDKPGWGEIHYTSFSGYDFKKNVVAVRVVSLQNNITPYEFRIHDSDFINNYLEFWIDRYDTTYLHNYYFYRNHYSGGWNKVTGQWYKYADDPLGNVTVPSVSHRGPKYHPNMNNGVNIFVSATPANATANLAVNRTATSEGYWIYDGEDQVTRIETGENLPLAQEALESLENDADVTIVADKGETTVAVWTFEGGE